jgi:putative ABC transport system permease protein
VWGVVLIVRLALRAVRWRISASIAVFVVATIAVLSATIGPIYLHATDQVLLTTRLGKVPPNRVDVTMSRMTRTHAIGMGPTEWVGPMKDLAGEAHKTGWFGPAVIATQAGVTVVAHNKATYATRVLALTGQCAHLAFVDGHCPTGLEQAAVSVAAAKTAGWHVGDRIKATSSSEPTKVRVQIVGIYRPKQPAGRYWAPWRFFDGGPTINDSQLPRLDSIFVAQGQLDLQSGSLTELITVNVPLVVSAVALDDVPALRAEIGTLLREARTNPADAEFSQVVLSSSLPQQLDDLDHEMTLTGTLVTLATVQLAVLAICVLYAIVSATAAVHGPEVALAKLRGRRALSVLAQGLLEPLILVLGAAVAGALLAWMVVRLVARPLLHHPVAVTYPRTALLVAVLTTAAAAAAAALAARRIVTAPIAALLRRGGDRATSSVGLAIADAVAVAGAIAGLVELSAEGVLRSGKPDPVAVIAPTLLAVAFAVVGIRLVPILGRLVLRTTRDSRRVAGFLTVRQIVRRSAGSRLPLVVAVALALAVFAVINAAVASTNRSVRALNQNGAARVLTVTPRAALDFVGEVDRADPSGKYAMAAALMQAANTPLLAVDTTRMAGIAAWRPDYSSVPLPEIVHRLRPATAPTVTLTGRYLRIAVKVVRPVRVPVVASAVVAAPGLDQTTVSLGSVRPGKGAFSGPLPAACARGCRLSQLSLLPPAKYVARQSPAEITVDFQSWQVADSANGPWRSVAAAVNRPVEWRAATGSAGEINFGRSGQGMTVDMLRQPEGGDWPGMAVDDVPATLPAVIASQTARLYPGQAANSISLTGLESTPVGVDGSSRSVTLPRLDRFGAMIDLTMALRSATQDVQLGPTYQVWLSSSAPKDILTRLRAQGITIVHSSTAASAERALQRTGPAFADNLFVVAAAAATLLAIGATVLGGLVAARRRAYELAALRAVGVAPRVLRRAVALEQGVLLGVGLLLGVAAGVAGARLALPSTPFFVSTSIGPPVEHALPGATIAVLCVVLAVLLALTCVVVSWAVARQATPDRLREAQQ